MRVALSRLRVVSERCFVLQSRAFCAKPSYGNSGKEAALSKYEAYRQLDNLDFQTAAKILFSDSTKNKKFGIDFHLVQLFFACMPSLAVYLVAQYARYEMRRMEEELDKKKKAEEEEKAKELELKALEEAAGSDPELLEVKERLGKLEETIKEIVVQSKKQSDGCKNAEHETGTEKQDAARVVPNTTQQRSETGNSGAEDDNGIPKSEENMRRQSSNTDASRDDSRGTEGA